MYLPESPFFKGPFHKGPGPIWTHRPVSNIHLQFFQGQNFAGDPFWEGIPKGKKKSQPLGCKKNCGQIEGLAWDPWLAQTCGKSSLQGVTPCIPTSLPPPSPGCQSQMFSLKFQILKLVHNPGGDDCILCVGW